MRAQSRVHVWALSLLAALALVPRAAIADEAAPYVYVSGENLPSLQSAPLDEEAETKINTGKLQFFCSATLLSSADVPAAKLDRCKSARRISEMADQVAVRRIAVGKTLCESVSGPKPEITFNEVKRRTMLGDGVNTLLGFVFDKLKASILPASAQPPSPPPLQWCVSKPTIQLLQLDRAQLTITAKYLAPKSGQEAEVKVDDGVATVQIITGPKEHFFLSGDAVVRGANEVKWDAATRTLVAQDKPNQLYLGVNYMFGDVYARHDAWAKERFAIKFLLQPSKKPFDSVGLALGYRFADGIFAPGAPADSGGFMVFAGAFWTRTDQLDAAGAVVGGKRERSWRVGVSYSLGTLLDWLK